MKKLYLDKKSAKVTGLCAGIAAYADIDVTVVRIIVLAVTLMSGIVPGVLFYIFASLIAPQEGEPNG